jgi:hypothetical protein
LYYADASAAERDHVCPDALHDATIPAAIAYPSPVDTHAYIATVLARTDLASIANVYTAIANAAIDCAVSAFAVHPSHSLRSASSA